MLYTPAQKMKNALEVTEMAWKTMDVHEQRVRFVVEAGLQARPLSALCAAYEISRPTGYLGLRRYAQSGVCGIAEQSRKPHSSPRRTDAAWERRVVEMRLRYPDWGRRNSGTETRGHP